MFTGATNFNLPWLEWYNLLGPVDYLAPLFGFDFMPDLRKISFLPVQPRLERDPSKRAAFIHALIKQPAAT
jgi:hypothetical protein